jgi:antitoxin YefM
MSTVINFTDLRQNLRGYIDQVNDTHTPITITTKEKRNAVLISAEDWSAIEESLYLNTSPANRTWLTKSLSSKSKKMTLDQLDTYVQS